MSTIKTNAILDASGGNTTTINGTTPNAYNTMGKNRIINGAMEIDQRNAGASVTLTGATYTLDRWQFLINQSSKFSTQQSSTAPAGFTNSLLVTSLSAYSVAAGDYFSVRQSIEGLNCKDLNWGTSDAKTVTISFWVRSSLTGTFGGAVKNHAGDRAYPFTYTISSADTWEQKSITVAGDTTGTWLTTNSRGVQLVFGLGVGSTYSGTAGSWASANYLSATGATSVVGTNGATWYITGVQLEVGSVATEFERRPYGIELALCQRYYYHVDASTNGNGQFFMGMLYDATSFYGILPLPVQMRANPTLTAGGTFRINWAGGGGTVTSTPSINQALKNSLWIAAGSPSGRVGVADLCAANDTSTYLGCSAEL